MFFDAHVHSKASPDSDMNPIDAIHILQKKGLGVTFTEHVDFAAPLNAGYDPEAPDIPHRENTPFVCDFDMYPKDYRSLRSGSVLLGLEIGLTAAFLRRNSELANSGDFDFILGSIHTVNGRDMYNEFPVDKDSGDVVSRYLTYAKKMVEQCGFFDSLTHIDFIARYKKYVSERFKYDNYSREFDALLKALIENDKVLEINTERLGDTKARKSLLPIYTRFAELGGKYCTVGSDAHQTENLGRNFKHAYKLAKAAGLQIVYYKERKRYISGN